MYFELAKNFKFKIFLYGFFTVIDIFLKLSAITFFVPLLEYMQFNGEIDATKQYWVYIFNLFKLMHLDVSFGSLTFFVLFIILLNEFFVFFRQYYFKIFPVWITIFLKKNLIFSLFTKNYATNDCDSILRFSLK